MMEDQAENPRIWMQRGDTQWTPLDGCPMVRCCVHRRHDDRCNEPAVWGEIHYMDDGGYRLTAFCAAHWDIHTNMAPPTYDIRINGQKYSVPAHALDYRAIVALAWGDAAANGPHLYSVVYSDGPAHNPEGILAPGEFAILQQDMDFEAMVTGNA
ncbi:MAG TPA: multiubiquitin domain-containing protein [Ktedonobacterales bacterium]|nr:multiubiquitin domain-containing protein [Ktedonobacterales bacterium]